MQTRNLKNRAMTYSKLIMGFILCFFLSFSAHAEYYLVTGGAPDVVWIGPHHRCYHHHRHYRPYHYVRRSPRVDVYLVWRQMGCGCCGCPPYGVYYGPSAWDAYNYDLTTADDNTWVNPQVQISYDDYTTYDY